MDKIDARIINQLKVSSKVSSALVKTLENEDERADAIVRVRNPLHLGFLERSFDVGKLSVHTLDRNKMRTRRRHTA